MSFNYLAIEFNGKLEELKNIIKLRLDNFEIKLIETNKIYAKVLSKEVPYLKFFEGGMVITKIANISEEDYLGSTDNDPGTVRILQTSNELVKNLEEDRNLQIHINEPKNEVKFQKIASIATPGSHVDNISAVLSDTVLPSKSPLDGNDPFSYLTSSSYLRSFLITASIILIILTIMD
jgi:hypothetical protein